MASYTIKRDITIIRQEGDNSDVIITIPDVLNIDNADITFLVVTSTKDEIIKKTLLDGITKDSQIITVKLDPVDTKGYYGNHKWELQLNDQTVDSYGIVTVGKGIFTINKEFIA